jgi:hypothetical protein
MEWGGVKTDEAGNSLYYDGFGNVTFATNNNGEPIGFAGAGGTAVLGQFLDVALYGVKSAIDASAKDKAISNQIKLAKAGIFPGGAPLNLAGLMPLALLGIGAVLIFKLVKG